MWLRSKRNRAELCRWLESVEFPYVPSSANFVLARVGERAPEIARRLRSEGILVRDWSYDPHLQGYLRFTIGSAGQTRRLIEELERVEHLIDTRNGTKAWRNFVAYSQRDGSHESAHASLHRKTAETDIRLRLNLDGRGRYEVSTGIRFLDHMLELFARHGGFDLDLRARGDLDVDQHHTVEDVGIVLGQAVRQALGNEARHQPCRLLPDAYG